MNILLKKKEKKLNFFGGKTGKIDKVLFVVKNLFLNGNSCSTKRSKQLSRWETSKGREAKKINQISMQNGRMERDQI